MTAESNKPSAHSSRGRSPSGSGWPEPAAQGDDGIDLSDIGSALRAHILVICTVALVVFGAVMTHTLISPMQFRASGRMYLGELDKSRPVSASETLDISGSGDGDVGSEVEILKSESLVTRAVFASGANVSLVPEGTRPVRFMRWLLSERDPSLLDVGAKQLIATETVDNEARGDVTYGLQFAGGDGTFALHRAGKRLGQGKLGEPVKIGSLQLTLSPGSDGAPVRGARYTLTVTPLRDALAAAQGRLKVTVPKSTGFGDTIKVVSLEYSNTSPRLAAALLEQLMQSYLEQRQSWKTEEASAAEAFVTEQLKSIRTSLDGTESNLATYRSTHREVTLDDESKSMVGQIGRYEEQRIAEKLRLSALQDVQRALKRPDAPIEAFLLGEVSDSVLEGLATTLASERQELSSVETRFSPAATEVRQQRARVTAQLEMIKNYVTTRLARTQERLTSLDRVVGQFEQKMKSVPGAELELSQLVREADVYGKLYTYLLERRQQAAITKASTVSKNRVLDPPQVDPREDSPRLAFRLSSLLFGLLLGCGVVIARRLFAATFQSESDVRRSVGSLPIYAQVPRGPRLRRWRRRVLDVLADDPRGGFAEAFRMLRTHLYQSEPTDRSCAVLVTSPTSADGKSTCVWALATLLAADGKRVLVLDADLRSPSLHELAGIPLAPGLSEVLGELDKVQKPERELPSESAVIVNWEAKPERDELTPASFRDSLRSVSLAHCSFSVLSAGSPGPVEVLSSVRVEKLLALARSRFDFVLIDSPCFPRTADPLMLAAAADCVLSVVRIKNTPRKLAAQHLRELVPLTKRLAIVVNEAGAGGSPDAIPAYPRRSGGKPATRRSESLAGV